jgi:hypothetical protein
MGQISIYHGGGFGGCSGFGSGSSSGEKTLYLRYYVPATEFKAVASNPPIGPNVILFPNLVNAQAWQFHPDELDIVFAHFCLPSRYWKYLLSGSNDITVRLHWFTENTSVYVICWRILLGYFRDGETLDVAPPAFSNFNQAAGTRYLYHSTPYTNFPLWNPSGSTSETEGGFYLKVGRDGTNASDTFLYNADLIGASVEIPLKYP